MTLEKEGLKGPVRTLTKKVQNWDKKNVVVQSYDRSGRLTRISFYGPQKTIDTIGSDSSEILTVPSTLPIEDLDTNDLVLMGTTTFEYDTNGDLVQETGRSWEKDHYRLKWEEMRDHDRMGNLIKKVRLYYDTTEALRDSWAEKWSYEYSRTDSCRKKRVIQTKADTLPDHYEERFFYGPDSNLTKYVKKWLEKSRTPGYKRIKKYEYSKGGDTLKKVHRFFRENKHRPVWEQVWTYDHDGEGRKVVERKREERWDNDGTEKVEKLLVQNEYEDSLLSRKSVKEERWSVYSSSGDTSVSTTQYHYNDHGDPIRIIDEDHGDTTVYEYKYDRYGNWTEQKWEKENGELMTRERKVSYY